MPVVLPAHFVHRRMVVAMGRTRFHDTADGIEVEIAPAREGLTLLKVVSAGFTIGIAAAIHGLLTGTGFGAPSRHGAPPPTMFLTLWVLGAACGVGAALRKIAWMLGGRETISLNGRELRLERSDPLRRVVRTFAVAEVSALRVGEAPEKLPAESDVARPRQARRRVRPPRAPRGVRARPRGRRRP